MSPLAKKLHIKPGTNWVLFNAPANYLSALEPLPGGAHISFETEGKFDGVQLFVNNTAELASALKTIAPLLNQDTIFWVIFPKKSSGIKSDMGMMTGWDETAKYGLKPIASIAVDTTWTALRFRPESLIKTSEGRNDNIRQNEHSEYIDVDNKQVKLSANIIEALQPAPQAMAFYQQLSYSNKKEYVLWILTAKQDKTRDERLAKMVEKLNAGKKNPSEK